MWDDLFYCKPHSSKKGNFHHDKDHHKKVDSHHHGKEKFRFVNPSSIVIPDEGLATPFPSQIVVSGVHKHVKKVTVTIHNFSHTFPDDVHILLVSPDGQSVYLMGDAGGGADVANLTITFDDDALNNLPDEARLRSGSFRPTTYGVDPDLPGPRPFGSALSLLKGSNPNGVWSLYVVDDAAGDSGTIAGGWSLKIETK